MIVCCFLTKLKEARSIALLPVKRTVKYNKFVCARASLVDALVLLGSELHCSHFHRRQNAEISLDSLVVVVVNVIFNRLYKRFSGSESSAVIAFPFQDAPEALHWAIVYAVGYSGHALHHTLVNQFMVEDVVRVLESPVTMEDRFGIRIPLGCKIKGIKYQLIVV